MSRTIPSIIEVLLEELDFGSSEELDFGCSEELDFPDSEELDFGASDELDTVFSEEELVGDSLDELITLDELLADSLEDETFALEEDFGVLDDEFATMFIPLRTGWASFPIF